MLQKAIRNADHSSPQLGRVLIVDDDLAMRRLIASYLSSHNCLTVELSDPAGILQHVESGGFSLIILDVHLGQKDGFDVLRQVRERSDIPVIMITGRALSLPISFFRNCMPSMPGILISVMTIPG